MADMAQLTLRAKSRREQLQHNPLQKLGLLDDLVGEGEQSIRHL
jgi:hypothetical protein